MAISTIGSGAGIGTPDYPNIQSWFDDIPPLGALTADEIGQILWASDANEIVLTDTISITGANENGHQIVLEAAGGDSFRDHLGVTTNALSYDAGRGASIWKASGSSPVFTVAQTNFVLRNLQIGKESAFGRGFHYTDVSAVNNIIDSCIIVIFCDNEPAIDARGLTMRNSILIDDSGDSTSGAVLGSGGIVNISSCTIARTVGGSNRKAVYNSFATMNVTNCAIFGFPDPDDGTIGGSFNGSNATLAFGANNQNGLLFANQFEAIGDAFTAGDFRLKAGSTLIGSGTASGTPTPPTTDIIGQPRSGTPDIGCWEFQGTAVSRRPTLTMLGIGA